MSKGADGVAPLTGLARTLVLGAAVATMTVFRAASGDLELDRWAVLAYALAQAAAVISSRWSITLALSASTVISLAQIIAGFDQLTAGLVVPLILFGAFATVGLAQSIVLGSLGIFIKTLAVRQLDREIVFSDLFLELLLVVAAITLGGIWADREQGIRRERELQERQAAEHEARLEQVRADERRSLAVELHDVVGHHVALMMLQAGVAKKYLGREEAKSSDALDIVAEAGQEAHAELRQLLSVLHDEGEVSGYESSTRSVEDIRRLVERVSESEVHVELFVKGDCDSVSDATMRTAYRIVQESLTNILKHSPESNASVCLTADRGDCVVSITDNGAGSVPGNRSPGGGLGLAGLAHRVELLGGTFTSGRHEGDGWAVTASIPRKVG